MEEQKREKYENMQTHQMSLLTTLNLHQLRNIFWLTNNDEHTVDQELQHTERANNIALSD